MILPDPEITTIQWRCHDGRLQWQLKEFHQTWFENEPRRVWEATDARWVVWIALMVGS